MWHGFAHFTVRIDRYLFPNLQLHSYSEFQIDRASAGNVKLSKMEIAKSDSEVEDEFGYTVCKL